MSMTMKLVLSCLGVFLGGLSQFWGVHQADPFGPRLWIGLAFAGITPLGAYFVGLAQKAPWDNTQPGGTNVAKP